MNKLSASKNKLFGITPLHNTRDLYIYYKTSKIYVEDKKTGDVYSTQSILSGVKPQKYDLLKWKWMVLNEEHLTSIQAIRKYQQLQKESDVKYKKETKLYFRNHIWEDLAKTVYHDHPLRLLKMSARYGMDMDDYVESI